MSLPGYEHGRIVFRVSQKLGAFVEARGLGEVVVGVDFILKRNPDMVRGPDVAFVSKASEVLRKVGDYLEAGTRLVWVVDPESQTVSAYRSLQQVRVYRAEEDLPGEDVLPGFSLAVGEIFA